MQPRMLAVFRNTSFGRETFLQSIYFAKTLSLSLSVYVPLSDKFLMYFQNDTLQIDLDKSYLLYPETAKAHAEELLAEYDYPGSFLKPRHFTGSGLPDITTVFSFMSCPRSMSDPTAKIALGVLGPRVRSVVRYAEFPILVPSVTFKKWKSISVLFGGSDNAVKALKLGLWLHQRSALPLDIISFKEKDVDMDSLRLRISEEQLTQDIESNVRDWLLLEHEDIRANIYDIPYDALVVLGAYGKGPIKDIAFGSRMEIVNEDCPNNILVVGPNASLDHLARYS